jgi:hypothetical protein
MNIDELKAAWNVYDKKVEATQRLNEKVIESMIASRSDNRFTSVKRNIVFAFLWMFGWASIALLICLTNPFDYKMSWQYLPQVIFIACVVIFMAGMLNTFSKLKSIDITGANVDASLKKIIAIYERPRKFQKYTLILFLFSQVVLFPLSFLPKGIERVGFWRALGEQLIPMSITAMMLYAAHKLGVFKEKDKDKFKRDLNELEELKRMSKELSMNNEQ